MKHLKALLLIALAAFLGTSSANAYDCYIDGIYYDIDGGSVSVTDNGEGCYSGDVVIPSTITYNGTEYPVTSIGERAFYWCSSLTSMTIPDGVTSIGDEAFYCCRSLTSVTIPESVTSIGEYAFFGCISLPSVTIPEGVTSIGNNAFAYCTSLTSVTIPESVTAIGEGAFGGCIELQSFYGKFVSSDNRCLIIDGKLVAFAPGGLTTYEIPEGVTSIENSAFRACSSLASVTIPEGVTSIGEYAFSYCSSLTSVTIPEGVTSIGNNAFRECSSLTSVTIPEGVTSIGDSAFWFCTSLTSVTISEGVTSIGKSAFSGCYDLTSIVCRNASEAPRCGNVVFSRVLVETCVLTVPASAESLYRTTSPWSEFQNIVTYDDSDPYTLTIEDGTLRKGFVGEIPVSLANAEDVVGVQFDVEIPEGVSLCVDEYGDPEVELSGRCDRTFTVTAGMTDGRLRVLVYSNKNHAISGNEGELVTINVTVDEALQPGEEVMFRIVNACVTPAIESGYIYEDVDCPDNEAIFEILRHHTPGDINDDGRFTAADIVYCVEMIMGNTPADAMAEAADVNEDGKVSISDIAGIVSLILTNDPAGSFGKAPKTQSAVETTSLIKATSEEPAAVTLSLDDTTNCVAMQFDITVPEGLAIEDIAAENQSAIYEKIAANRYRAIIYSPTNQELANNAAIIRFSGSSFEDIQFNNILLTVKESTAIYELASAPTVISNIQSGVTATSTDKEEAEYYNLQGVKVGESETTPGIYLRNNKKVIVK